ncbi:MAG: hypothetical protein QG635_1552 [Bacteroidota bacterium]|nr:hypothetical protein [Bacteroidota bacterium]
MYEKKTVLIYNKNIIEGKINTELNIGFSGKWLNAAINYEKSPAA